MTVEEVVKLALQNSNTKRIIENNNTISGIEGSFYRISLLPKLTLSVTLPYQRSISEIIQADGSIRFIERNFLSPSLNVALTQALPFIGGSISVNSSLNNNRDFNNGISNYSSNWANVSYQQTINGYNTYKWARKINPLYRKKDSITYLKEILKSKYEVSKMYVDVQLVRLSKQLILKNIDKTNAILKETIAKQLLKRALQIDVEQIQIALEQLMQQQESTELDYELKINKLSNLINYNLPINTDLSPITFIQYELNANDLLKNMSINEFDISSDIKLFEMSANVEKIKKEGAIAVSLQMGLGLNSTATELDNLYRNPAQSQFATISTKIPILDWGKSKKSIAVAKIEKENMEFELKNKWNDISSKAKELEIYHLNLLSQKKSLEKQILLNEKVNEMFIELFKYGRKTIAEFTAQLVETYNLQLKQQKNLNEIFLLKLQIDEITLTL